MNLRKKNYHFSTMLHKLRYVKQRRTERGKGKSKLVEFDFILVFMVEFWYAGTDIEADFPGFFLG